jgi:2-iminobutanoate/2-iminopropanoate deaminase
MKREIIETDKAPRLPLPFSQAMKFGNWVFVSGQGPIDPVSHEVRGYQSTDRKDVRKHYGYLRRGTDLRKCEYDGIFNGLKN